MTFFDELRKFGAPIQGEQMAAAAPTVEANDTSTPSPTGRVLARLPTPGRVRPSDMNIAQGPFNPPAENPGLTALSDLTGGMSELHPGLNSKNSFLVGLMGSMRNAGAREEKAQAAQTEAQKANLEYFKSLFEMDHKASEAERQANKDAEDVRHNKATEDLTGQHYSALNDYYKRGGIGGAASAGTDINPKDLSLVSQRAAKAAGFGETYDKGWSARTPEEQERARQLYAGHLEIYTNGLYTIGPDGRPMRVGAAPAKGAPATPDAVDPDAPEPAIGASPAAPAAPSLLDAPVPPGDTLSKPGEPAQNVFKRMRGGGAPPAQPAAAAPVEAPASAPTPAPPRTSGGAWRPVKAPDGSKWLFNTITGDKVPAEGQ